MQALSQAIEAHRNGRLKEARAAYGRVLEENGGDSVVYRCFAHLLNEIGEGEKALEALRKAHECENRIDHGAGPPHHGLFLKDAGIAAELAAHLLAGGKAAEAEKYAREAVRVNPSDSLAIDLLIRIMGRDNRGEEALELYENAPESVRFSFFGSKSMSSVLAASGRFGKSMEVRNNGLQIPQPALRRIRAHTRLPLTTAYMIPHAGAPLHADVSRLEMASEGGISPLYVRLEEARVLSGEWFVMGKNQTVFLDMNHGTPTGDPTPYYQDPGNSLRGFKKRVVVPEPVHERIDRAVLVGGDPNFYHWTADFLPRLMAVGKTPALADYPILVHENILDYQRERLAIAGIGEDRLIPLEYPGCYPCGELIVPLFPCEFPRPSGLILSARAISWLRALATPAENGSRRIYISRRDAGRRRIANEEVLMAALEDEGFESLELSGFSQKEQIDIFSTAEIVVGCHGAGLTNLAFAPSRCRLIEILDPGWSTRSFELLAGIMGQQYDSVMCRRYFSERKLPIFGDAFITDGTVDEVLRLIQRPPGKTAPTR